MGTTVVVFTVGMVQFIFTEQGDTGTAMMFEGGGGGAGERCGMCRGQQRVEKGMWGRGGRREGALERGRGERNEKNIIDN